MNERQRGTAVVYKGGSSAFAPLGKRQARGKESMGNADSVERPANAKRVKACHAALASAKVRCKRQLSAAEKTAVDSGLKVSGNAFRKRAVIVIDQDCFYAQVLLQQPRNRMYQGSPFGVTQKYLVVTCNYAARHYGVGKLMRIEEAKRLCPNIVLQAGEDLTLFRDASRRIFEATKAFFVGFTRRVLLGSEGGGDGSSSESDTGEETPQLDTLLPQIEKSGLDEMYIDCTALCSYMLERHGVDLVAATKRSATVHILEQNTHLARNSAYQDGLLLCATEIAADARRHISSKAGFESCAGVSCNKLVSKLAVNMHKPNQQSTVLTSAIVPLMLDLPVGYLCGVGRKIVRQLETGLKILYVRDALRADCTLFDLQETFGERVGRFLFLAFRGIDESPVVDHSAPKSIGVEDSMLGVRSVEAVYDYLRLMARDLFRRLVSDAVQHGRRPATLVLKVRHTRRKCTSKQAHLPVHLASPEDVFKVSKLLLQSAVNLSAPFSLTLIGISCNSFVIAHNESVGKGGPRHPKTMISNYFGTVGRGGKRAAPECAGQAFVSSQARGGRPNFPLTVDTVDVSVLNELPKDLRKEILGQLRISKTRRDTKKRRTVADYFSKG